MDNKKLFLISGAVSIAIYIAVFLAVLLYFLKTQETLKKFTIKQKSVEVSLVEAPKFKKIIEQKKDKIKKSEKPVKNKKQKVKKRVGSKSPKDEVDIAKLFSTIKTPKKSKKKIVKSTKKSSTPPSRFKGQNIRRTESAQEILKKMNIKDVSRVLAKSNIEAVNGEDDPYLSKIYEILYKYWLPSQESAGNRAKVMIKIDFNGNFDYNIIFFSSSETFNKELVEYLEYLKTKKFPQPKEGKKEITVFFEAKE
ncbi:TonB C-terminal domain-containing protein [Nitrosophilus labii]|uniref:TonB C-terminal domain-containing protein n=1 Tax=Nitrosophilus labii TaxID=2706014 RepID=UPI001657035D|nr:TonB C-terminal domain-containing protein [Nitrosophilus labii]